VQTVTKQLLLPKKLAAKKAIINLKNEDDQCFKWAVTRALNDVDKNAERIDKTLRQQPEKPKLDGIEFSVSLIGIDKFEKSNDLSVNVFGYEKRYVYPLKISSKQNSMKELSTCSLFQTTKSSIIALSRV